MQQQDVYILFGGNEGNVKESFLEAEKWIQKRIGTITSKSSIYASPPWGFQSSLDFLNQVIAVQTGCTPNKVLEHLLHIETLLGRNRTSKAPTYSNRPIDLDILYFGNAIVREHALEIPHPRLHLRRFTLAPLAEIAPNLVHPTLHQTQQQLLHQCPDHGKVTRL